MHKHFKSLLFRAVPVVAAALAAMLMLVLASAALAERPAHSRIYPKGAHPFGKSYPAWTAAWWQWGLALPVEGHPFLNDGFFDCNSANNGQSGRVWFLALSPSEVPLVERSCTIPAHTALLLALTVAECSDLEGSPTARDQRACANFFADHVVESSLFCTIDGEEVKNEHLISFRFESRQFAFTAPEPWIFSPAPGGSGTAVSDGYFLMIKPLSRGAHTLRCGGAFHFSVAEGDPFDLDIAFGNTYHLTVQ